MAKNLNRETTAPGRIIQVTTTRGTEYTGPLLSWTPKLLTMKVNGKPTELHVKTLVSILPAD